MSKVPYGVTTKGFRACRALCATTKPSESNPSKECPGAIGSTSTATLQLGNPQLNFPSVLFWTVAPRCAVLCFGVLLPSCVMPEMRVNPAPGPCEILSIVLAHQNSQRSRRCPAFSATQRTLASCAVPAPALPACNSGAARAAPVCLPTKPSLQHGLAY